MHPKILALGLVALALTPVHAADLIPVEDFARAPRFEQIELSPDGEYLAFVREDNGTKRLFFADVATMKIAAVQMPSGKFGGGEMQVFGVQWISPTRVVFATNRGPAAVDRDRKHFKHFGWQDAKTGTRRGMPDAVFLHVVGVSDDGRTVWVTNKRMDQGVERRHFPDVSRLDTITGIGTTAAENPASVNRWIVDARGSVRIGVTISEGEESVLYRANDESEWRTLFKGLRLMWDPVGFTPDGGKIYVFTRPESGGSSVCLLDPETGTLGEPLWKNPVFAPREIVWDRATRQAVGVRYHAEIPKTQWLDSRYTDLQATVDATLPGRVNELSSFSSDLKRVLVTSYSDRQPIIAYVFNAETGEMREVGKTRAWLNPEAMAQQRPVSFVSRDSLRLFGYLTVPVGVKPEGLPMVVIAQSFRTVRETFEFNPFVQMLANRGYAVLQISSRGSHGYTWQFHRQGDGQTGTGVQNDIEDGARWAIAKKIADPARVAIVGHWYGGFSALFELARGGGVFRCGVAGAPISDWESYIGFLNHDAGSYRFRNRSMDEQFVDFTMTAEQLSPYSPIRYAEEIKAPVLVIKRDDFSPEWPRQADRIVVALEKAGNSPERISVQSEWPREKRVGAEFKAIEAFLAKHLGGEVGPATAEK